MLLWWSLLPLLNPACAVMLLMVPPRYKVGATQGVLFLQDVNWGHGFILQTAEHGHALHTKLAKKWHWSNHIPYVAPLPRPGVFIQWGKGCGVAYGPSLPGAVHHGEKVAGLCAELCVRVHCCRGSCWCSVPVYTRAKPHNRNLTHHFGDFCCSESSRRVCAGCRPIFQRGQQQPAPPPLHAAKKKCGVSSFRACC